MESMQIIEVMLAIEATQFTEATNTIGAHLVWEIMWLFRSLGKIHYISHMLCMK